MPTQGHLQLCTPVLLNSNAMGSENVWAQESEQSGQLKRSSFYLRRFLVSEEQIISLKNDFILYVIFYLCIKIVAREHLQDVYVFLWLAQNLFAVKIDTLSLD